MVGGAEGGLADVVSWGSPPVLHSSVAPSVILRGSLQARMVMWLKGGICSVSFQHLPGPGPVPSSVEDSIVLPGQSQHSVSWLPSTVSIFFLRAEFPASAWNGHG